MIVYLHKCTDILSVFRLLFLCIYNYMYSLDCEFMTCVYVDPVPTPYCTSPSVIITKNRLEEPRPLI